MATGKLLRRVIESGIVGNMKAKRADPDANTSAWEREIEERVYRIYGLTPD